MKFRRLDRLNLLILNQYKGNNSCATEAILTKLDVRQRNMVIYIHIMFHEIPVIGYLVMSSDGRDKRTGGRNDGQTDGHRENYFPSSSAGEYRDYS